MQIKCVFDMASNSKHGNFCVDLIKSEYGYHLELLDSDEQLYACQKITANEYSELYSREELSTTKFTKLSNQIQKGITK